MEPGMEWSDVPSRVATFVECAL